MSELKITGQIIKPYTLRKVKDGHCLRCGKRLRDKISKFRGYGKCCWDKMPVAVVLELRPDPAPERAG